MMMNGIQLSRKEIGVILAACAIAVAALLIGASVDAKSLLVNALAGVATMIGSVLLAVFVVDRLLESARKRRWSLVSDETIETLQFAVVQAALALYLCLPAPRPITADPYTMSIAGTAELATALNELGAVLRKTPDSALASDAAAFPTEVDRAIGVIRDSVMPRLLTLGEADLVASVAQVEARYQSLLHSAYLASRFGGEHVANATAELCAAMSATVAIDELAGS